MTDRELKTLKDNLWHAADVLRSGAHLAANKYGQPILGLIFLRYADILFKQHKDEIEAEYTKRLGTRMEKTHKEIAVEKCGFFLPECAYYDYLNNAPDTAEKADLVKKAMEAIERENPKMDGVLPKEVYAQLVPEEEPELLSNIVRISRISPKTAPLISSARSMNTSSATSPWQRVRTAGPSIRRPQSCGIWSKCWTRSPAIKNFSIPLAVPAACLSRLRGTCTPTMQTRRSR